ncbi:MAG: hypothetical protein IJU68_02660 [Bacteroidales bacterium]|nr:hypothetical protein [Bacteroidales bacterium]
MNNRFHILFLVLLAVLLAGCAKDVYRQAPVSRAFDARMCMDVSIGDYAGMMQSPASTKADFVAVDEVYRFASEQLVGNIGVYVFDASDAYTTDGGGKLAFDPSKAVQLFDGNVVPDQQAVMGSIRRIEFTAPAVTSMAVLVLANVDDASLYAGIGSKGSKMSDVVASIASSKLMDYDASASYGTTVGIPMCGWKLFGSLEGETDLAAAKASKGLKFYRGMSTPLTQTGFASSAAVDAYYSKGFVADEDLLRLERRLSRIHLYFKTAVGKRDMTIVSARVQNYRSKISLVPSGLFGSGLTPFDAVTDAGTVELATVSFREISTGHWVAYVPEFNVAALAGDSKEPCLIIEAREDGTTRSYLYTKDKVTVSDPSDATLPRDFHYAMPWLRFITQEAKVDKNGDPVAAGTYFNLVGNYTYEWIATGIEL